jgi:hypothetical protein
LRALASAGIRSLAELSKWKAADIAALHGMGPTGVRMLEESLAKEGRSLRK